MQPVMMKMSRPLTFAATASTLALAAFALGAPMIGSGMRIPARPVPMSAGVPAPTLPFPGLLPR